MSVGESLTVQCPMPGCDHEAQFRDFHDPPNSGCDECGASLEELQAAARDDDAE